MVDQLKSLFPKVARSNFMIFGDVRVIHVRVSTRVYGKSPIFVLISDLIYASYLQDQKCVLKVIGLINNVVILVIQI